MPFQVRSYKMRDWAIALRVLVSEAIRCMHGVCGGGGRLPDPELANLWDIADRGEYPRSIVEPVDAAPFGIDPLTFV